MQPSSNLATVGRSDADWSAWGKRKSQWLWEKGFWPANDAKNANQVVKQREKRKLETSTDLQEGKDLFIPLRLSGMLPAGRKKGGHGFTRGTPFFNSVFSMFRGRKNSHFYFFGE